MHNMAMPISKQTLRTHNMTLDFEVILPDTHQRYRPCAILILAWGSIGGLQVLIVVRQVRQLPACTAVWV